MASNKLDIGSLLTSFCSRRLHNRDMLPGAILAPVLIEVRREIAPMLVAGEFVARWAL
jgi:hypothetical protein